MDHLLGKPFNTNKHLKEEFVSNLEGSSMLEIAALSAIVSALVVLRQWSCSGVSGHFSGTAAKTKDDNITYHKDWRGYTVMLAMDFFCAILPILFIFTVLAEWTYFFAISLICLMSFCISFKRKGLQYSSSVRASLLSYRVQVVVVTCLCILAVDFRIFPRRYAKTETSGTSLMDLGVGSFVVANSLVSRQARNAMSMTWKAALKLTGPLALLGFGRLIFTTGVDYQVHVGEYGVHWNFFFTLAAVSIVTFMINIHPKYCGVFGLLILIGYQICLIHGLTEYLLSNERSFNIISQNKEGLFSIFGYWGMYLVGVHLGYCVFFGYVPSSKIEHVCGARIRVWILCVLFWLLTVILDNHVERVSRRTCNMAYVSLVFAQNFQVLSVLMLSDFLPAQKPLALEEAYNRNLLGSFLLANILTGVVNLFVDTLSASSLLSFCILSGYAFVLSAVVGLLGYYGIKLKFW